MVKSEEEIKRLTRSTAINERACEEALKSVMKGQKVGEVIQIFGQNVVKEGALPEHQIYSRRGLGVSEDREYEFRCGDIVFFDFGCTYKGYISDTGNTIVVGKCPENVRKIYRTCATALSEGLNFIMPGARSSEVAEAMRKYLASNGIRICWAHGHGIGLEPRDYPAISTSPGHVVADDFINISPDFMLEENMVLNLEVPYYLFGLGSFIVEKTIRVTKNGFMELVKQDRENPVVAQ
jgi:Xaa-Pro aminopeptidase